MTLKQVLMERDELTEAEAEEQIAIARQEVFERLEDGDLPYDICEELFGLEPDFLEELIF